MQLSQVFITSQISAQKLLVSLAKESVLPYQGQFSTVDGQKTSDPATALLDKHPANQAGDNNFLFSTNQWQVPLKLAIITTSS